jgi:uncharacterized membrane protein YgdD (TMEM256/DUF423 family)
MVNPLTATPAETPDWVYAWLYSLAMHILPTLFICLCILMLCMRIPRAPYFTWFCVFGTLGAFCLGVLMANSPISAGCLMFSLIAMPVVLICNFFVLRKRDERTVFHRAATWASLGWVLFSGLVVVSAFLTFWLHPA